MVWQSASAAAAAAAKELQQNAINHSSLYGPLNGSDNDAGFSYKYDHFQYSRNDNDDESNNSLKTHALIAPPGQFFDETAEHTNGYEPHYKCHLSNDERDAIGGKGFGEKVSVHESSSLMFLKSRKQLFEAEITTSNLAPRIEKEYLSPREYRDDNGEEDTKVRDDDSRNGNGFSDTARGTIEDVGEGDLSATSNNEHTTIVGDTRKRDEHDFNLMDIALTDFELELDEKAIEDEAAEEVAYIMALSKSNHYSIMLRKDFNPKNNNEHKPKVESEGESSHVEGSSSNYSFEKTRHNRLLEQQQRNRESLHTLRSKLSLHSKHSLSSNSQPTSSMHSNNTSSIHSTSVLGKNPSQTIDVTADSSNSNQSEGLKSEDELEQALYRAIEAALCDDSTAEIKFSEAYRETIEDCTRSSRNVVRNESGVESIRSSCDEFHHLYNGVSFHSKESRLAIEHDVSEEKQQVESPRDTLVNQYCDRDGRGSSANNIVYQDPEHAFVVKQTFDLRFNDDDVSFAELSEQRQVSVNDNNNPTQYSNEEKETYEDDDILPRGEGREEPAAEVENILIDLICRKKFNFALQRVHYFPHETFTPASSSVQNLALHELMSGMVLVNDALKEEQQQQKDDEKEGEHRLESSLLELLIETNSAALATPGDGGYLPLHIACSASFRDGQTKVSLIQKMLVMHPEGVSHNTNKTGELPLHLAIRAICTTRQRMPLSRKYTEESENEAIVMFLLMAYPGGAIIRDHSGLTPCDIVKSNAQEETEVGIDGSALRRIERYLSFASELSQDHSNNNDSIREHSTKDDWESQHKLQVSLEERDGPPIDNIEFADTMSDTEHIMGEGKKSRTISTVDTNGNGPQKEVPRFNSSTRFYDVVDQRGVFEKSERWSKSKLPPMKDSRTTKGPSPKRVDENDGYLRPNNERYPRKTTRRTRKNQKKIDAELADKLLDELLDASNE